MNGERGVEVEDEGARPLDEARAQLKWRNEIGAMWSYDEDGFIRKAFVPKPVEAAIRKEAIAAHEASTVNMSGEAYADILARAAARAEAAEGARDEFKRELALMVRLIDECGPLMNVKNGNTDSTGSIDEGDVLTWRVIEHARALTAESVTPTGETQ